MCHHIFLMLFNQIAYLFFRIPTASMGSDDEPIYDHVASDDDYYNIPDTPVDEVKGNSTLPRLKSSSSALAANPSLQSSPAKSNSSGNSASVYSSVAAAAAAPGKRLGNESLGGPLTTISHSSEYYALKQQLENSEHRVQALIDSNGDMRNEISRLSVMVNKLVNENHALRSTGHEEAMELSLVGHPPTENEYAIPQTIATAATAPFAAAVKPPPPIRSTTTSVTMTPTNQFEQQKRLLPTSSGPGGSGPTSLPVYVASNSSSASAAAAAASAAANNARHSTTYQGGSYLIDDEAGLHGSASLPVSGHDFFGHSGGNNTNPTATCLPSQEEVVRRTEAITRCIQELVNILKRRYF